MERPDRNDPDEIDARREADRAAQEAGAIGGSTPEQELDPADHPLAESGQGYAEGFERAEEDLREAAENLGGGRPPQRDAMPTEPESGASGAAYAETDNVESTGTTERAAERDAARTDTSPNEPDPAPRPEDARGT